MPGWRARPGEQGARGGRGPGARQRRKEREEGRREKKGKRRKWEKEKKKKKEGKKKGKRREGERDPRRDHGADRGAGRPRLASGRAKARRAGRGKNRTRVSGLWGNRKIWRNREDSGKLGLGFQGGVSSSTTKQNFSARFILGNFRDVTACNNISYICVFL